MKNDHYPPLDASSSPHGDDSQSEHLWYQLATQNCMRQMFAHLPLDLDVSEHCHGQGFFNPTEPDRRKIFQLLKWMTLRHFVKAKWSVDKYHVAVDLPQQRESADIQDWKVYFIGHATTLIQIGKYNFLTDPVWSDYASPMRGLGPKRFRPMGLALQQLPRIDAVLLSHNHYDHMDLSTLNWLVKRFNMPIYTGLANRYYLPEHFNVVEMDWWQREIFHAQSQIELMYLPAQHASGRGIRDQNQALWGGFSIITPAGHAYFAGDTGYCGYFSEIRQRLGAPRVALLPIGAYEPRHLMQYVHMNAADAVQAHLDLQAKQSIAIHQAMFQLTDEAMFAPRESLKQALQYHQIDEQEFICLAEGLSINC